jgi:hypothetical protein
MLRAFGDPGKSHEVEHGNFSIAVQVVCPKNAFSKIRSDFPDTNLGIIIFCQLNNFVYTGLLSIKIKCLAL